MSAATHTPIHRERISNSDSVRLWPYFTVWVNKIALNLAVFARRLDYDNGNWTSELNCAWLHISDVSYCLESHSPLDILESASNLPRERSNHVFCPLYQWRMHLETLEKPWKVVSEWRQQQVAKISYIWIIFYKCGKIVGTSLLMKEKPTKRSLK